MPLRLAKRLSAIGFVSAAVLTAACHTNSTSPSNHVNLTGTFGLASYVNHGDPDVVDADDSGIFVFTTNKYYLSGTGHFAALSDSGTYVALDTATVNGILSGSYSSVSEAVGSEFDITDGIFRFSANTDTLALNYTVEGIARAAVFVRSTD